jgi:acetyl esterase/lipase
MVVAAVAVDFAPLSAQPQYPPDIPEATVEVFKSVEGVDLKVWILVPEGHDPDRAAPAMVFFFGGGMRRGSPVQFLRQARRLASQGLVAILADYRVLDRNGTGPSRAVEDAKSAIRWVRAHAVDLGVDPTRIGAAGGSSGGQLAASAATLPDFDAPDEDASISSLPDLIILFNPALVIAPVEGLFEWPEGVGVPADVPLIDLSPYHHVGGDPVPTLILHGAEDELFPPATVEAYCTKARDAGGLCEVEIYPNGGHGFFNRSPHFELTLERAEDFLRSLGWLEPIGRPEEKG